MIKYLRKHKNKLILFNTIFIAVFLVMTNKAIATENLENTISEDEIIKAQQENLNIDDFIQEADVYTENVYEDIDIGELFSSAITGNIDNENIFKSIINSVGGEVFDAISVLGSILVIIVIHSILRAISEGLENKGISQIIYYVQYILIVTLIMTNFVQIIDIVKNAIQNLVEFMNMLIPILITLMITTGSIVSANLIQPLLLFLITFAGNFIVGIIIPIVLISTSLGIVSNISDKIQINKLSNFFKSSSIWILGIILTIFVGLVSIEGTLSSNVDGITAKTAKAAVSSFIPVVGKILGDAVDTVIGCSSILKNATGIVGIIVLIGIAIIPIIKLAILMGVYYLTSAVCQPIADEKITKLLDQIGDTFKILLGIMCSISVMFIIGTTLIIKISNSGMMYR
jgi:stage III sporulation protein AE